MLKKVNLNIIEDANIRNNMDAIKYNVNKCSILTGQWKLFELTFTEASSNYKHPHGFPYIPKDIIHLSTTGSGTVTFNYNSFDDTFLDLTASAECKIRFLSGLIQPEREVL